jgi:hypothetical protein
LYRLKYDIIAQLGKDNLKIHKFLVYEIPTADAPYFKKYLFGFLGLTIVTFFAIFPFDPGAIGVYLIIFLQAHFLMH